MIVVTTKRKADMEEDVGWERWSVVVAAFFTQFIVCGITYSLGVFHVVFKDIFYESHFDTAWIGSILLYITALSSVMLRFVTSLWGSRVSVMAGGVMASAGLALCAAVQDLYQLYLSFGLLVGIGFGLACSPSIVAVERSFIHARSQALSVVIAGIGAGIITFPIIIRYLLEYFAWRGTFLILSGVALNLCVCGAVMRPRASDKELHLLPLLSCLPMRVPLFHGMCVANLFWSFGSTVIYMYLPAYAISQGTSFETCTLLISCIGISSLCARMIFAFMGQNSALDEVMSVLCAIGLGVVLTGICPLLFDHYPGQIGYTLLFGFYSGFWTTFLSQVSRELIGPEYIALGNGYLSFMIALGALTAGPAAGLLIQEENEYKHAFYLAGSCLLWSSIIMIMFKLKRCVAPSREEFEQQQQDQKDIQKVPLIVGEAEPSRDPLPTLAEEIVVDTAIISSV
ncbi:monocarboxylate transporter 12-like [Babylonia areolata]|uniref:monocarboxylate transporter 12-like n=1 Tax=Babylonia areolata TaxID=304850 RepID=UPI003FD5B73C